ncbi:MAG: type II secretion system protein [Lentisphaerae bacterium]|nr:type II secretion system protein [Lentisphaerota bacterium]
MNALRSPLSALRAFTLIELLVVILVIAILLGITFPVSRYVTRRVREERQKVMLANIKSALEDYRASYGEYPISPPNANWDSHYPQNFATHDAEIAYSPYTNVSFTAGTTESIETHNMTYQVDYSLTYPLMYKQLEKGRQPFMQFPDATVVYVVYQTLQESEQTIKRKTKSGGFRSITLRFISGDPVNRAKAVDPVSGYQWKYESADGLSYTLSTHPF